MAYKSVDEMKLYLNKCLADNSISFEVSNELWYRLGDVIVEMQAMRRIMEISNVPKVFLDNPLGFAGIATKKNIEWVRKKLEAYEKKQLK